MFLACLYLASEVIAFEMLLLPLPCLLLLTLVLRVLEFESAATHESQNLGIAAKASPSCWV